MPVIWSVPRRELKWTSSPAIALERSQRKEVFDAIGLSIPLKTKADKRAAWAGAAFAASAIWLSKIDAFSIIALAGWRKIRQTAPCSCGAATSRPESVSCRMRAAGALPWRRPCQPGIFNNDQARSSPAKPSPACSSVKRCSSAWMVEGERSHQSLGNQTPDVVHRTAIGGGAVIVDKFGGAGEKPLLRYASQGFLPRRSKSTKQGQTGAAPSSCW